MDFKSLTLQEMRYIYAAKCDQLETLIDTYWAGSTENLEAEPTLKDQIRELGQEIQELEQVIAHRKSEIVNNENAPN